MLKKLLSKVSANTNLTTNEAGDALRFIVEDKATPAQIGAFLTALSMKGETIDEITGFAGVMRDNALFVDAKCETAVDVCGTGGDGKCTFNVSTAVGFVVAGAGAKVAKHGNRASSSKCGSADVLKSLGVNIEAPVETVEKCIERANIGFIFAPFFHQSMKNVAMIRKEIGIRTVFNILGPITNPARVKRQVIGVFSEDLTETLASVLKNLGSKRAFVVHGMDGMDEISIGDRTKVSELVDGSIKNYYIAPEDFNIKRQGINDLVVNTAEESAAIIRDVLAGKPGPGRDIVVLNAGAAIAAAQVAKDINEGVELASKSIDSKSALNALNNLVEVSCL